jgi:cyclopropane-fatty-acyl-phospholipid synthase
MAQALQKIIANRYGGRNLPVTLVLPDGGRVPLSSEPEVEILARTWRGLKALAAPAMGALARAYVHNDIDFTGSAGARPPSPRPWSAKSRPAARRSRPAGGSGATSAAATARTSGTTTTSRTRSTASSSTGSSSTRARISPPTGETLEDAQMGKLDHICRKLRLAPGERFLDIGCGWGALVFRAATQYGVEATGITLSKNQYDYVSSEIKARGLTGRVRVELRDYLDLPEDTLYDKIASVGMFEHVGIARFPKYFGKIHRILKPGGFVLNHGITQNKLGAETIGSGIGDFVDEYVFPGGELAHAAKVIEGMAAQGLEVIDAEALREHYAKTLWHWCERLEANADAARAEVGEEKYRVWRSTSPDRRTRSNAAGCRSGKCSPASRSPTDGCRIR